MLQIFCAIDKIFECQTSYPTGIPPTPIVH